MSASRPVSGCLRVWERAPCSWSWCGFKDWLDGLSRLPRLREPQFPDLSDGKLQDSLQGIAVGFKEDGAGRAASSPWSLVGVRGYRLLDVICPSIRLVCSHYTSHSVKVSLRDSPRLLKLRSLLLQPLSGPRSCAIFFTSFLREIVYVLLL